jgi:hypothetical protein
VVAGSVVLPRPRPGAVVPDVASENDPEEPAAGEGTSALPVGRPEPGDVPDDPVGLPFPGAVPDEPVDWPEPGDVPEEPVD